VSNIQTAIRKDTSLSNSNVNVNVGDNNEIVLTGTVQSSADKDHAEQIARSNAPGSNVVNKITVGSSAGSTSSSGSASGLPQSDQGAPSTTKEPKKNKPKSGEGATGSSSTTNPSSSTVPKL